MPPHTSLFIMLISLLLALCTCAMGVSLFVLKFVHVCELYWLICCYYPRCFSHRPMSLSRFCLMTKSLFTLMFSKLSEAASRIIFLNDLDYREVQLKYIK